MPSPDDLLALYAELALGLAGFVGVVSAFAGRDREFRPTERVRFLSVVLSSATILTGCFAFFTSSSAGLALRSSYALAGAASLVVWLSGGLPVFVRSWRRRNDADSSTEMWSLYVSLSTLTSLGLLYGGAVFTRGGLPLLVAGFSLNLLHGLWMFTRLLTRPN